MAKARRNHDRESRIYQEIIVDAYKQKATAAVVIPPEEVNGNGKDDEQGTLIQ